MKVHGLDFPVNLQGCSRDLKFALNLIQQSQIDSVKCVQKAESPSAPPLRTSGTKSGEQRTAGLTGKTMSESYGTNLGLEHLG